MMSSAVDFIAALAPQYNAAVERIAAGVILRFSLSLSDGRTVPYAIKAIENGLVVSARELTPTNLPSFCPQRHVNYDGSFCLYWRGAATLDVVDEATAAEWWDTLWKYLTLQVRAQKVRRWPNDSEWAHGLAAQYQFAAETSAAVLSVDFATALKEKRLHVVRRRKIYKLYMDGVHIFSVWCASKKVVNQKQRCFCGSSGRKRPKRIRRCGEHAAAASTLAIALVGWEVEEASFWKSFEGKACCNSCDDCPLKSPSTPKTE